LPHAITGTARRGARALRSVGPGTVAVAAVALVIGGAGVADAATGGNFILGGTNIASSTSVLTDTTGIPLSLNAVAGQQPFSVNNAVQVNRLNAQYVGGESAAQLQSSGGVGITSPEVKIALADGKAATTVASTGALPAGTYYVSATALAYGAGDAVFCIVPATAPTATTNWGGGGGDAEFVQAAETNVVTVPANTIVSEACYGTAGGQFAYNAGITAIRIDSSSVGTKPTAVSRNAVVTPPKS
jgi:hypothetical protein